MKSEHLSKLWHKIISFAALFLVAGTAIVSAGNPPDRTVVPEEVRSDGYTLRLRCEAWRDRMPQVLIPGMKPEVRGLKIMISLAETAKRPIKEIFTLRDLRLFQDGNIWSATFPDAEPPSMIRWEINRAVANPPDWATGTVMDVIVRVTNRQGSEFYIQSTKCRLEEVW